MRAADRLAPAEQTAALALRFEFDPGPRGCAGVSLVGLSNGAGKNPQTFLQDVV
jgi:hypothetical protein